MKQATRLNVVAVLVFVLSISSEARGALAQDLLPKEIAQAEDTVAARTGEPPSTCLSRVAAHVREGTAIKVMRTDGSILGGTYLGLTPDQLSLRIAAEDATPQTLEIQCEGVYVVK